MMTCQAPDCGKELRSDNSIGYCRSHLSVTSRLPERLCVLEDCGNRLRVTNKTGYCYRHADLTPASQRYDSAYNAMLRERSAEKREQQAECSVSGCTKRLRSDNHTGKCRDHNYLADRRQCLIKDCENSLIATNRTGRCQKHKAKVWVALACGAEGCEKLINGKNLTGFCGDHTSGYRRDYMLRRNYGMTLEQHDVMLAEQDSVCALCGLPPDPDGTRASSRLHVDHDHQTGQVRALLCLNCNRALAHSSITRTCFGTRRIT